MYAEKSLLLNTVKQKDRLLAKQHDPAVCYFDVHTVFNRFHSIFCIVVNPISTFLLCKRSETRNPGFSQRL